MRRRVVKLGGSLLNADGTGVGLKKWLQVNADMQNVIVVGGGETADAIRGMQQLLNKEVSHELACKAMSINAFAIAHFLSVGPLLCRLDQIYDSNDSVVMFDSSNWILGCSDVPRSWDFTSDSIAAKLATEIDAEELVLIKSRMGELSEPGFVDACFAKESKSVKSVRVSTLIP